jgi:hypothetical protein
MALVVNASAVSDVPGIKRRSERQAEPLLFYLVNKGFHFPGNGADGSANEVCLIADLLWQS